MDFILATIILGLTAGFSPGPLMTLIISETMKHDLKAGLKVSVAPILTDLPIVTISLFILSRLTDFNSILGIISFCGAGYIIKLGIESLRIKGVEIQQGSGAPKSLIKGFITNLLSPSPYLFWMTVGAPKTISAYNQSILSAALFIFLFYFLLVGSKIFIACIVHKTKDFLKSSLYIHIMRFLGIIMLLYAGVFIKDGIKYFLK